MLVHDVIASLTTLRKDFEASLTRIKSGEKILSASRDPIDEETYPLREKVSPALHAPVTRTTYIQRKLTYLNQLIEILQHPFKATNISVREVETLLKSLTEKHVYINKQVTRLFDSSGSVKGNSRASSPEKPSRPQTGSSRHPQSSQGERPNTPLDGSTPSSPYLSLLNSSGIHYPEICIPIAAGRNIIRSSTTHRYSESTTFNASAGDSIVVIEGIGIDSNCHCILHRTGDGNSLSIESNSNVAIHGSEIWSCTYINGVKVDSSCTVTHGDILCIGVCCFVQINIPFVAKMRLETDSVSNASATEFISWNTTSWSAWEVCILQRHHHCVLTTYDRCKKEARQAKDGIDDFYGGFIDASDTQLTSSGTESFEISSIDFDSHHFIDCCEFAMSVEVANFYAWLLRKRMSFAFLLKMVGLSRFDDAYRLDSKAIYHKVDSETIALIDVVVTCKFSDGSSSSWGVEKFSNRISLMEDFIFDFSYRCGRSLITLEVLYPLSRDPFHEIFDDELIGTVSIHNGHLLYLLDTIDVYPITSFQGYTNGLIKVHVRAWLDSVEENPSYINTDNDVNLENYVGHQLIIIYYFENIIDIPDLISSKVFVQLKFYHHGRIYRSSRYHDKCTSPRLGAHITVHQKITPDFIDFVRNNHVDLEVWGRRDKEVATEIRRHHAVGENEWALNRKTKVICDIFIW